MLMRGSASLRTAFKQKTFPNSMNFLMRVLRYRAVIAATAVVWSAVIAYGMQQWMVFEYTPGIIDGHPPTWPAASRLRADERSGTLIVFVHPRCACTRATLNKLAVILTDCPNPPSNYVVLSAAGEDSSPESEADLQRRYAEIFPNSHVILDRDGSESKRFGATTSGFILFFNKRGRLRFSGGITPHRGGEPPCDSEEQLAGALRDTSAAVVVETPTFGCSL